MNAEVTAVVEKKIEEKEGSSCTECAFVELGQVTEQTKGGWIGGFDGGPITRILGF